MIRARLAATIVLALAAAAHADGDAKARGKDHAAAGGRLFDVQQYDKAIDEFQQAYLADPQPSYLYALAQAQRLAGDCTKALRSYASYLRTNPDAAHAELAQKNITRCTQDLKDHPPVEPVATSTAAAATPAPIAVIATVHTEAPPEHRSLAGPIAITAAGAITLGIAIGVAQSASSLHDQAAGDPVQASALASQATAESRVHLANELLAVGGGVALAGIVWGALVLHGNASSGTTSALAHLRVGPGTIGVAWTR